jgi:hypothetical protein
LNASPDAHVSCGTDMYGLFPIDELTFDVANPSGMDLRGVSVVRLGDADNFSRLAACTPDPCQSAIDGVEKPLDNACLISGGPTTTAVRVRMYTKQRFRPTEMYRLQLWVKPLGATDVLMSNAVESSVVRMPDASNDHPAFIDIRPSIRNGSPQVDVIMYVPVVPAGSPGGVELDYDYYNSAGRLFAKTRLTDTFNLTNFLEQFDFAISTLGPPWRLVLRLKQTVNSTRGNAQPLRCNDDLPSPGVPACRTNPYPPSTGTVVWETTREIAISN